MSVRAYITVTEFAAVGRDVGLVEESWARDNGARWIVQEQNRHGQPTGRVSVLLERRNNSYHVELCVLLILANKADDNGWISEMPLRWISDRIGLAKRQTIRVINRLELRGELRRFYKASANQSNKYQLTPAGIPVSEYFQSAGSHLLKREYWQMSKE